MTRFQYFFINYLSNFVPVYLNDVQIIIDEAIAAALSHSFSWNE